MVDSCTGSHKTKVSRLCESQGRGSFFLKEIATAYQHFLCLKRSAQLTHLTKVSCSDLFTMIATNKIYLGGVEHFAWLSHNLLTVVLCDPVYEQSDREGERGEIKINKKEEKQSSDSPRGLEGAAGRSTQRHHHRLGVGPRLLCFAGPSLRCPPAPASVRVAHSTRGRGFAIVSCSNSSERASAAAAARPPAMRHATRLIRPTTTAAAAAATTTTTNAVNDAEAVEGADCGSPQVMEMSMIRAKSEPSGIARVV